MPSETLKGDLMQWDFAMDAWVLIQLPSGIDVQDRRAKMGVTAEQLSQRGMPQQAIAPHTCFPPESNCDCRGTKPYLI